MAVELPPITRLAAERTEEKDSALGAGLGCIETDGLEGTAAWHTGAAIAVRCESVGIG